MVWLCIVALCYCLILIFVARAFIFPYRTPVWISPAAMRMGQEEVSVETADGQRVSGWWVSSSLESPTCVVIMIHGFMMNRAEFVPDAHALWERGCACLIPDLRGHGLNRNRKSGLGWSERHDVRAWIDFAKQRHPSAKLVVMGSSMGAAATAFAVSDDPSGVDAIVLDGAYGRLLDAVSGWWDWLAGPIVKILLAPLPLVAWPMLGFNPYRLSVTESLKTVSIPTLLIHGEKDRLALPSGAIANFEALAGPKHLYWFPKCGHSESRWKFPEEYDGEVIRFLTETKILSPLPIMMNEGERS